jgi:hypothetical protein
VEILAASLCASPPVSADEKGIERQWISTEFTTF